MSNTKAASHYPVIGIFLSLPLVLAGCQSSLFVEGGPEMRYLTSTPPAIKQARAVKSPLLPLTVGSHWEMRQIGVPPETASQIDVRITKRDDTGSLMEIRRDGQLWRREVYTNTSSGLFLTAMGEDTKPMMRLSPPMPIALYPAREGNSQTWSGTFRYGNVAYSASGYSRISALETVVGPTGKSLTYRTDTLVAINQGGNTVKFPTLRWLTPGVGFARRSFVDQGRPIYAELQKFTPG